MFLSESSDELVLAEAIVHEFGHMELNAVMDTVPLAALDLPLKLLVWDDEDQARVSYLKPAALRERHGLAPSLALPLAGIDQLTDAALTDAYSA